MVETKINLKSSCKQENWQKSMLLFPVLSPSSYPYLLFWGTHLCSEKIIYVPVQLSCFTKPDTALEKESGAVTNYYFYSIKKTNWNSKIIQIKWAHTSHRLTKFKSKFWRDNRENSTWSQCLPFIYLHPLLFAICRKVLLASLDNESSCCAMTLRFVTKAHLYAKHFWQWQQKRNNLSSLYTKPTYCSS